MSYKILKRQINCQNDNVLQEHKKITKKNEISDNWTIIYY